MIDDPNQGFDHCGLRGDELVPLALDLHLNDEEGAAIDLLRFLVGGGGGGVQAHSQILFSGADSAKSCPCCPFCVIDACVQTRFTQTLAQILMGTSAACTPTENIITLQIAVFFVGFAALLGLTIDTMWIEPPGRHSARGRRLLRWMSLRCCGMGLEAGAQRRCQLG